MANRGMVVTAKPFDEDTIKRIKIHLKDDLKWLSLFVVSINSAFRATDVLKLKRDEVEDDGERITLFKKEKKTTKNRRVLLGVEASKILRRWLKQQDPRNYVWVGIRGPHTYGYYSAKLKEWTDAVGAPTKRVSTHSCRKAWVSIHLRKHKTPMHVLMKALNHSSEAQVLAYAGITSQDLEVAYAQEL